MTPATSTIIILIFVFSIIGGMTGKHEPTSYTHEPSYETTTVNTSVEVAVPVSTFDGGNEEGLYGKIKGFVSKYAVRVSGSDADQISESIIRYSKQYDINPKLVTALIARESRFNKFAISSSGAQGLGQLLPSTSSGLDISDPFDIDSNVRGTTRYIKSMLDRFSGSNKVPYAIAGYFEGPNAVTRNGGFKDKSKDYVEDILKIYQRI